MKSSSSTQQAVRLNEVCSYFILASLLPRQRKDLLHSESLTEVLC